MKSLTVSGSDHGKRIYSLIRDTFVHLPAGALYKAFRKKDIKVNGKRIKVDYEVSAGDRIEIYIIDDILYGRAEAGSAEARSTEARSAEAGSAEARGTETRNIEAGSAETGRNKQAGAFKVVYEDGNILIVNKSQGVPVHPDSTQAEGTLIDLVKDYLRQNGIPSNSQNTIAEEFYQGNSELFTPSLCHRLDRNTGGLVIIAKNSSSLKIMLDKIKNKEVRKYYRCLVFGKMEKNSGELKAYLDKDENKSRVFVYDKMKAGLFTIITRYKVISYDKASDITNLEVELITGRTHQIRAHMAFAGHPVVGDGKYGRNIQNRTVGARYQALWACKIHFDFKTDAGILNYLKGRIFEVEPGFKLPRAQ